MNDLISRSALIKAMENKFNFAEKKAFYSVGLSEGFIITEEIINEQPTVDAVPAVNGEWIPNKKLTLSPLLMNYSCSICGTEGHRTNFCPNCGADMRKKVQHG